jgi:hypothetical protein
VKNKCLPWIVWRNFYNCCQAENKIKLSGGYTMCESFILFNCHSLDTAGLIIVVSSFILIKTSLARLTYQPKLSIISDLVPCLIPSLLVAYQRYHITTAMPDALLEFSSDLSFSPQEINDIMRRKTFNSDAHIAFEANPKKYHPMSTIQVSACQKGHISSQKKYKTYIAVEKRKQKASAKGR